MMEQLYAWRAAFDALGPLSSMVVAVALGLAAWAVAVTLVQALLKVAERVARGTSTTLDDELLGRIRRPAMLIGPVLGAHAFAWYLGVEVLAGASSLVETLLLTYAGVATFEILVIETWLEKRQGLRVPNPIRQLAIGLIYGAVLLGIGGDVLGFDLTPLLATGSITSLVLGLALQQPLSNLFAGIILHVERHPTLGDWLLVDGNEGEVMDIGWRSTRLRTLSRDTLVVPNLNLLTAQVLNFTHGAPECGRKVPVPMPLDVPPHVFDRWVREVLAEIDGVEGAWEPRTKTWLVEVDAHCLRYVVRFWATEFRTHDDCESEFLKRLWYKLAENGIQFPATFQAVKVVEDAPAAMASLSAARPGAFPQRQVEGTPAQGAPTDARPTATTAATTPIGTT